MVELDELFDAYAVPVQRYLFRRLAASADPASTADDLTADVFLIAWQKRAEIPADAALPWLYAVARRVLANHRRRRTDIPVEDLGALDEIDESDPADLVTRDAALAEAWRTLSPRDREVLRLAAWEGLSGVELGAALGVTEGGAVAALSRARARLAEAIDGADAPEGIAGPVQGSSGS
ncbi:MAG: RNA polymerase sigma factor [Candidatus Nanopelagicales bacterium]